MKPNARARWLMGLSLLLLVALEATWLYRVYQDERRNLKQQADLAFMEAVDQLQDSLIQAVFLRSQADGSVEKQEPAGPGVTLRSMRVDTCETHEPGAQTTIRLDTNVRIHLDLTEAPQITFSPKARRDTPRLRPDTSSKSIWGLRKVLRSAPDSSREKPSTGMLSVWVNQFGTDGTDTARLFNLLEDRLAHEDFGTAHQLVILPADRDHWEGPGLLSRPYTDTPTDQTFALLFAFPTPFLLRNMWLELLFALLLLSIVSLAFFTVFRSLKQQQRLTRLKNDFISNVTHELKTPITTVRVALEALQSFDALQDPQRTREYLNISRQELDRLSLLVDRVLKMSLFEREKMEIKPERIELGPMLSSIVSTMQLQFRKHAAQVDLHLSEGPIWVQADRLHLTSVVVNLLDNALKYSPEHPQVTLSLVIASQQAVITVADRGLGIPPQYQDKIFDKFFRVPHGDHHDVKGHGLGLSYVAEVMRRHQGCIEVDSELGVGTTFCLSLPHAP